MTLQNPGSRDPADLRGTSHSSDGGSRSGDVALVPAETAVVLTQSSLALRSTLHITLESLPGRSWRLIKKINRTNTLVT